MTIEWTIEDDKRADHEGWGFYETSDDEHEPVELERVDFPDEGDPAFDSDLAAWEFVVTQAKAGSEFHIKAPAWLKEVSLVEWDHVTNLRAYA